MCLQAVEAKIRKGQYKHPLSFRDDVELIVHNAVKFNTPHDMVYDDAWRLHRAAVVMLKRVFNLPEAGGEWLRKALGIKVEKEGLTADVDLSLAVLPSGPSKAPSASPPAGHGSGTAAYGGTKVKKGSAAKSPLPAEYSVLPVTPLDTPKSCMMRLHIRLDPVTAYGVSGVDMCVVCGSAGDPDKMMFCCDCGEAFHCYCLAHPIASTANVSSLWRCTDCLLCSVCGDCPASKDAEFVYCECCDAATHMSCMVPPLTKPPKGEWYCWRCVTCQKCDTVVPLGGWSTAKDFCSRCNIVTE